MKFFLLAVFLFLSVSFLSADPISARQKFFESVQKDPASAVKYLNSKDAEIRRYALYLVIKHDPVAALEQIEKMVIDPEPQVRMTAAAPLPALSKKNKKAMKILREVAAREKVLPIRKIALQALWPFHREIKLLRNDPTWDYEVKTVKSIPLQNLPWLFTTDPMQDGHLKGFFKDSHNV